MELETLFVTCFLSVLVVNQAASGYEDVVNLQSTPAYLIVGRDNGEIWRCDYFNPTRCEFLHGTGNTVSFTVVHGEFLFAALKSGKILRCELHRTNSCAIIHQSEAESDIICLAVAGRYLYAGLKNGIMLRCDLMNLVHTFQTFTKFNKEVRGMYEFNKDIYVATSKYFWKCGQERYFCSMVQKNKLVLLSVSHLGNTFIKISWHDNDVWYYNLSSTGSMVEKNRVHSSGRTRNIAVFRRRIYVLTWTSDIKVADENSNIYTDFVQSQTHPIQNISSISFVYAVRYMQSKLDGGSCVGQRLPSAAFTAEQRWLVEVTIVGGELVDSRGGRVDTRGAGAGRSGRAVFAMGPGGQILLTNEHTSGLVHIPSFFAGGPVAGAGEMQVENGVIKRIVACSVHYWPDVRFNRQVVDELYRKGYTRADEIILEECSYNCDKDEADVRLDL